MTVKLNASTMRVREYLEQRLDADTRRRIDWRVGAMVREMGYIAERRPSEMESLASRQWSRDRLEIICALNSFYQMVLAPLSSWAHTHTEHGFGRDIVVTHGQLRFDETRRRQTLAALLGFFNIVRNLGIPRAALRANHFEELVVVLLQLPDTDESA